MTKSMKSLLAGVSVLALGVGVNGALAADPVDQRIEVAHQMGRTLSGTVGMYGANSFSVNTDSSCSLEQYLSLGGDAKVDIPFSENFSIQLDIYGEGNLADEISESEDYAAGFLAGIHANYREQDNYLLGVFAGVGTVANGDSDSGNGRQFLAGIEGQYHMADWTFYGQGGITTVADDTSNTDWLENGWFARGVVRKYFNGGDGRFQADLMHISGENSTDESVRGLAWGVEAEHMLKDYGNGFITGFARYEGYSFVEDNGCCSSDDNSSAHVFKAGIKISFGYNNPMSRDRYGAGVDFADMSRINSLARAVD